LDDPIAAPANPITAGDCVCICKKPTTGLNQEVAAVDVADTSLEVNVDIEDPPG
jgi:hypothetical protein